MDGNERIQIKKINEHVYLMDDAGESTGYLVTGRDKALVIDTMNGIADVKKAVRSITNLPIMVVNTHGHGDHVCGNVFFEEAFVHPFDRYIAEAFSQMPDFAEACRRNNVSMPPFRDIREGEVIDLGGITVEIILLQGHTPGSILLLDREDRILFTGDAINRHLWLQLDDSLPLEECLANLKSISYLEKEADYILHGHARDTEPITLIGELRDALEDLCAGNTDKDPDYRWFGNMAKMHYFRDGVSAVIYPAK